MQFEFEFERDGVAVRGGLRFERVRAFQFRSEGHFTVLHVAGVYDTLAEVTGSEWLLSCWQLSRPRRGADERSGTSDLHRLCGLLQIGASAWSWVYEERLP